MVTVEERIKILTMVQDGKITAEEAAQLIEAVDNADQGPQEEKPGENTVKPPSTAGRHLVVRVYSQVDGKKRVNVRLPIGLVKAGIKMGAKFSPEVENLDVEELLQFIESGETGQFVDVYDEEDGNHVEVLVE